MSELGETFRAYRLDRRKKKDENQDSSIAILVNNGIEFKKFTEQHLRVAGDFDFWPRTGTFINLKTREIGRGVYNLLARIGHGNYGKTYKVRA